MEEEAWARAQADKLSAEIKAKGLVYRDDQVQAYLLALEQRLLVEQPQYADAIQVFVLRSPTPNAFALPNGVIYLNSGLFTALATEEQLAAVLAHEIAHVTQLHSVKSVIGMKNTLISAHIADLATGGLGLAYIPAAASIMGYSRDNEVEADQLGVQRLQAVGYNPQSMVETFERFKQMPELKHVENSIYSSHPSQDRRVEELKLTLVDSGAAQSSYKAADNHEFAEIKAQLMEVNTRMRLEARQFYQAQAIIDEARSYFGDTTKIAYYEGEVFYGLYSYPVDAAEEKYWIETGKQTRDNMYVNSMNAMRQDNLAAAEVNYLLAIEGDTPVLAAYKRLGEIEQQRGEDSAAIVWFQRYLVSDPNAPDRRYVERLIQKSQ